MKHSEPGKRSEAPKEAKARETSEPSKVDKAQNLRGVDKSSTFILFVALFTTCNYAHILHTQKPPKAQKVAKLTNVGKLLRRRNAGNGAKPSNCRNVEKF